MTDPIPQGSYSPTYHMQDTEAEEDASWAVLFGLVAVVLVIFSAGVGVGWLIGRFA